MSNIFWRIYLTFIKKIYVKYILIIFNYTTFGENISHTFCHISYIYIFSMWEMSKNFQVYFIHINLLRSQTKKFTIEPKSYTAMLLYLFFDSSLSTWPKNKYNRKNGPTLPTLSWTKSKGESSWFLSNLKVVSVNYVIRCKKLVLLNFHSSIF